MFNLLADAAAAPTQNLWQTVMMIGVAVVFFYFILWRPEKKRRKAMETKRSSMQKGDQVTAMGIIGKVVKIDDATVTITTGGDTKIEMLKAAITDVTPASAK
ncbi:MAG: preprotein translocase subunit YajC [Chlamydiia bacterium]|nr:preprotein translocase subunit YajC [Chlamydiia bacterium]